MKAFIESGKAVMGIEFGSTRIKAVLVDDGFRVVAQGAHDWENRLVDGAGFRKVAEMRGQARALEAWTDQTGLQFYAGNFIQDGWTMKDGRPMKRRSYLALETQHFPNSPNRPDFPTTNLRPGEVYRTVTEYRFKAR